MEQTEELPSIPELFKGKIVLITGATGFLGKVLVEKLLRSCPDVKEVLLLLRPLKKGKNVDVNKRLEELRNHHVFDELRKEERDGLLKLRALAGSIEEDNLGLSGWQLRKVIAEVSFIFHCAANVRFDDEPRNTFNTNLLGVKNVLDICGSCKQLQAFVHVSTAYCFCNYSEISEKTYPELLKPQQIIEILRWMTNEHLRTICMEYMQNRPSMYHFSKALAEILIAEWQTPIPAIIVRPSIVTASVKEPFQGWIDNYNGPSGFIAVCGKSIVKTLFVKPDVNADWVPVDIVANTLIVAAHYIAVKSNSKSVQSKLLAPSRVPIINCTCPPRNVITWEKIIGICLPFLAQYPSLEIYGKPGGTVTSSKFRYYMCRLMSHYIPALFMDIASFIGRGTPKMLSFYNSIHGVMGHLEHYTTHSYVFHSPNMRTLVEEMDPVDAEKFPIDQSTLDWKQYMENYVLGVRRYFLKESDETLPEARKKMMRLHYLKLALKVSSMFGIYLLMWWSLRNRFSKLSDELPLQLFSSMDFLQRKIYIRK